MQITPLPRGRDFGLRCIVKLLVVHEPNTMLGRHIYDTARIVLISDYFRKFYLMKFYV